MASFGYRFGALVSGMVKSIVVYALDVRNNYTVERDNIERRRTNFKEVEKENSNQRPWRKREQLQNALDLKLQRK